MDLTKLFKAQAELDERIVSKKGLEGQDLLDKKILALLVELGELANEARFFKFWSEDQKPNRTGYIECDVCTDQPGKYEVIVGDEVVSFPCQRCEGHEEIYVGDRLLEEYVDCLHFILSIGLELGATSEFLGKLHWWNADEVSQFNALFVYVSELHAFYWSNDYNKKEMQSKYKHVLEGLLGLGKGLGFTCEQIEQAYFEKNKVNHERQENGY